MRSRIEARIRAQTRARVPEDVGSMGKRGIAIVLALSGLAGACTPIGQKPLLTSRPQIGPLTSTESRLVGLAPPTRPISIAVYEFPDLTGQHRPNEAYADYSRAVTQGAATIVVESLKSAGKGAWFDVAERTQLANLLRERQLIQDTYRVLKRKPDELVQPLQFAEYLVEGGIIGYDSSILSGGVGAAYLGLGGNANYKKDFVSVILRVVRVKTGEVVASATASKTIFSISLDAALTRVVVADKLLKAEAALTQTEPTQIAVREAVEAAVVEIVRLGSQQGIWQSAWAESAAPQPADARVDASALRRPGPAGAAPAASSLPRRGTPNDVVDVPVPYPPGAPPPATQDTPQSGAAVGELRLRSPEEDENKVP